MKNLTILLTTLVAISLNGIPAFSAERQTSKQHTDNFIGNLKKQPCHTLNDRGDHFPNLGPIQEEFYNLCITLDRDNNVKKPIVVEFGGANGLRAAEALQKTKRVTVILNDLDGRHFEGIRNWSDANGFKDRLILVPGTFFNIFLSEDVQKFFGSSPFELNGILATNVFHHTSPEEFIKGLGFISNHLAPQGEAFFMNEMAELLNADTERKKVFSDAAVAQDILALLEENKKYGERGVNAFASQYGEANTYKLLRYWENRQISILTNFNRAHGISFPGVIRFTDGCLNPFLSAATNDSSYFKTTPEEIQRWSKIVGLTFHSIGYLKIHNGRLESSKSNEANYYYGCLKKSPSSTNQHYLTSSEYMELINLSSNIDNDLKKLHANKKFEVFVNFPHFKVIDLKTEEYYPSTQDQPSHAQSDALLYPDLWNSIFEFNSKHQTAVYSLGAFIYNLKINNPPSSSKDAASLEEAASLEKAASFKKNDLAASVFTMGADLGYKDSYDMLSGMHKIGQHPYISAGQPFFPFTPPETKIIKAF